MLSFRRLFTRRENGQSQLLFIGFSGDILFPLFMRKKEISTGADSGNHFAPKGCRVVLFRTKLIGGSNLTSSSNGCGLRECFSFPVGVRLESFFIIL